MNKAVKNQFVSVEPVAPRIANLPRGDAALGRYMSELSDYDLLTRDQEIALAQDVQRLEVAYWRALLSWPRAFAAIRAALGRHLEALPAEVQSVQRLSARAAQSKPSREDRARYDRAAQRLADKLRVLDVHRDAVKAAHASASAVAHGELGMARVGAVTTRRPTKVSQRYLAEVETARREQQAAKDRFVSANLRLVVSMARRYARQERMPLSDLIQEGNLGLIKAVERFDHTRGFRFSTYASWWIRHALTRGLADKSRLVRLPVHALENRARIARVTRTLLTKNGVAPTTTELVEETGLSEEKILLANQLSTDAHFSLDAPVGNDTERTFVDYLRYDDESNVEERIIESGQQQSLTALLGELSPFEAQILRFRYGFGDGEERTLKEIGDMYNLSRERIRQIQAVALDKMRARMDDSEHAGDLN